MRAVLTNPFLWLAAGGWVFSSAVQALPEPTEASSVRYIFLYKYVHLLGANWTQYNLAAWLLKLCGK
jgi:hypothetical protein